MSHDRRESRERQAEERDVADECREQERESGSDGFRSSALLQ